MRSVPLLLRQRSLLPLLRFLLLRHIALRLEHLALLHQLHSIAAPRSASRSPHLPLVLHAVTPRARLHVVLRLLSNSSSHSMGRALIRPSFLRSHRHLLDLNMVRKVQPALQLLHTKATGAYKRRAVSRTLRHPALLVLYTRSRKMVQ